MSGRVEVALQDWDGRDRRRFLQPLAIALVSLLLAILFLAMAMMDLRRLESLLAGVLKMKAVSIIESIEKASQNKYVSLARGGEEPSNPFSGLPIDEDTFSIQESLARALIDLGRNIDYREQTGSLSHEEIQDVAAAGHISAVIFLDEEGQIVFRSNPAVENPLPLNAGLVKGQQEIAIHLFNRAPAQEGGSYVGIRRQKGKGAVLLVLDGSGLQYWEWRIAIQGAIDELQWGKGVVYLAVADTRRGIVAQAGSLPEAKVEECMLMAGSQRDPDNSVSQCMKVGDVKFLELSLPFHMDGKVIGTALVGLETQETDRLLVENRRHVFLWAGLMMTIGLLAMTLLYRTQNRHISRLQAMQERLYHAERLSSLGKLGAGVAHEIRNPLNAVSIATQRLQRECSPQESEKKLKFERITQIIRDEIKRLNGIIEDFLSLSRSSRVDLRRQSMGDLLEKLVFLVREEAQEKGIRIERRWIDPAPFILMDVNKMQQALLNLIRNAMEAIPGEGSVVISIENHRNNLTIVKIHDTGMGIPPGEEGRIFDPFYTTKERGLGLGLCITHEIILAHGGEIRVESEQGKGTTFEILLPRQGAKER
jgi:signal transduction histidine kinase